MVCVFYFGVAQKVLKDLKLLLQVGRFRKSSLQICSVRRRLRRFHRLQRLRRSVLELLSKVSFRLLR